MMSGEFLSKMEHLIGGGKIKTDVIHNVPTPKELYLYFIDIILEG